MHHPLYIARPDNEPRTRTWALTFLWLLVASVLLLMVAGCGEDDTAEVDISTTGTDTVASVDNNAGTPGSDTAGAMMVDTAATAARSVDVTLTEFKIEMPESVPAGRTTFAIRNAGTAEHNFEVEGNDIEEKLDSPLAPGATGTLTVDLKPGTYEIYCPVDDHKGKGMERSLTVTQ